jgi:signal peptidase I
MKSQTYSIKQKLPNNTSLLKNLFFFLPLLKFVVREESMEPLLFPGDALLINRFSKVKKNDIVIFKNPQKNIKAGYLIKKITKINGDKIYVEGINKEKSIDSRHFGWVSQKDVIGKMIFKL